MEIAFAVAAAAVVAVALGVELRFFAPQRAPGRGEAIVWAGGWLLVSLVVAGGIALADGPAGEWTTVYLIERSLSLDNVFLFSLLLAYFLVPPELRGRAIAIGVGGALLLRAVAISAGVALVDAADAVLYVFGALLLYVAYRAFRSSPEASDPTTNRSLRLVRRTIPVTDGFRVGDWSCASRTACTARRSCSSSPRSSSPTSRSRSTRFRPRSPSPTMRS
jgi:tellurite resistance protein TerC